MKTPEEMAEEYAELMSFDVRGHQRGFLAGYKAAQDQVADASKVIAEDSCEHILDMEKMVDVNSSNNSNGWISVKDRLPKKNILILCCSLKSLSPTYGWFDGAFWNVNDEPNYFKDKIDCISFITHWMPLPEAPKGEK